MIQQQRQNERKMLKNDEFKESKDRQTVFQISCQQNVQKTFHNQKTDLSQKPQKKLPENMRFFLKNKRIIQEFAIQKQKQKQNSKIKAKFNKKCLNVTNDSIIQSSIVNLEAKNQDFFNQSQQNNKKVLDNIVHPEIQNKCSICQGNIDKNMTKKKVFKCIHSFCSECTKNYIIYKINRFQVISCPNQNCKELLDAKSTFYQNEIDLKFRKKYKKIETFYQTSKLNERVCPQEKCEGIIIIDKNQQLIHCNVCKSQYCAKCYFKKHQGECLNYETQFMIKTLNLVQCDKCKNFIEKTEGCNHITCKCGYQFCQRCKQEWKGRHICKYSIFNNGQQGWGGCDLGLTTKDHIRFLLKIPFKIVLVMLCAISWLMFSFLGVPLNLAIMIYWLYLLLIKPTIYMIKEENSYWKMMVQVIFFPFLMIKNVCRGKEYLVEHLDRLLPQIPNSFRWIIRL